MLTFRQKIVASFTALLLIACLHPVPLAAQNVIGAITGTIKDATGASVPDAIVVARNTATNLTVTVHTENNGSYSVPNLPVGIYELTFTKSGFETETHTQVIVQGDRTTTVDGSLKVGATSATVEVTGTPLMNQVDTTNGYTVDRFTIQQTPLGTGSFTQLAILSPGVHADFLGGSGSNAGLGNQAIFANGQRDTSNSFQLNGVSTNNLFNGNSSSQVGENRFVENTGENFGAGGSIQTSTSIYSAIGQALPTPAPETIQEISVNAAMYDASQGANSGAHISVITQSGTNSIHGQIYEHFQNSAMNAAPFFYNASTAIPADQKVPFLNRNMFGATLGGPIKKDKLFYFVAYQGTRIASAESSTQDDTVPLSLTDDRSAAGLVAVAKQQGTTLTASQISPQAMAILNAKLPNGSYLIPSASITNATVARQLGYDAIVQGPNSTALVDQGNANIDYVFSDKDRLAVKYYIQNDPTTSPYGYGGDTLGFPQQLAAGNDVASIDNTVVLTPSLTWQQRAGFTRLRAFASNQQGFSPSQFGINLLGATNFPYIDIQTVDSTLGHSFTFGTPITFGNGGMFQNQWEYGTTLNWVKGRHTISIGAQWDHTQLNILNKAANTDSIYFTNFVNFLEGNVRTGNIGSVSFAGSSNRYYRSDTVGSFINDSYKIASNLTLTMGLRWDFDGPLSEEHGYLTAFNPSLYQYNAATDTIVNSGLEFAGNNSNFATPGASDSLMTARQWILEPRIGIAYSPTPKITVRTGFGMYADRGEFFSELSPSAGSGYNGPFGVTLSPPFVTPVFAPTNATFAAPFGTTAPPSPPGSPAAFQALLPNLAQTASNKYPAGNLFGPFLFGGYAPTNKLPYSENWTFDIQYQPANSWLLTLGYVGNHGVHEVLPVPFNQPLIATPQNPVNGQIYSYGFNVSKNAYETLNTFSGGNVDVRVPYIGYNANSVYYEAEGISWYNAFQVELQKRLSHGVQITASYTRSHSLDEQSGLGLFYTGNNPDNPKSGYASSDFDQPNVFLINYTYQMPKLTSNKLLGGFINGWIFGGQTIAQSGEPYSVYDYHSSVASLYYGSEVELVNPIVNLVPSVTGGQAQLQGTTGVNAGKPVLNANDFAPEFLAPGQDGVPPCDSKGVCDTYESVFSGGGRNIFRAPFQVRFDLTLGKDFQLSDRFHLRFNVDAFNVFNHPSFDAPNDNVQFFSGYTPPLAATPIGSLGLIQHTIGSPRFLQLDMHLTF